METADLVRAQPPPPSTPLPCVWRVQSAACFEEVRSPFPLAFKHVQCAASPRARDGAARLRSGRERRASSAGLRAAAVAGACSARRRGLRCRSSASSGRAHAFHPRRLSAPPWRAFGPAALPGARRLLCPPFATPCCPEQDPVAKHAGWNARGARRRAGGVEECPRRHLVRCHPAPVALLAFVASRLALSLAA